MATEVCKGKCYSLTESGAGYIDPCCPVHAKELADKERAERIASAPPLSPADASYLRRLLNPRRR